MEVYGPVKNDKTGILKLDLKTLKHRQKPICGLMSSNILSLKIVFFSQSHVFM